MVVPEGVDLLSVRYSAEWSLSIFYVLSYFIIKLIKYNDLSFLSLGSKPRVALRGRLSIAEVMIIL